jgi:hypothetical protein
MTLTLQYRNRSYHDIDVMFQERVPARKFSTYKTPAQLAAQERTEEGVWTSRQFWQQGISMVSFGRFASGAIEDVFISSFAHD